MKTRFAPSPTGPLHLGHGFSALTAYERGGAGDFVLRIEDIDTARARPHWEVQIYEDLRWLGLRWPDPVMRQSERLSHYRAALERLWRRGLLYECHCTRRDIAAAASAPQEGAPLIGPDGIVYPGTCRHGTRTGPLPEGVLRLDMAQALEQLTLPVWQETGVAEAAMPDPEALLHGIGDVVLARRGMGTSYHLAVVVDDAAQDIEEVVRGADLAEATPIHLILQTLLGLNVPRYHHHRLIRDDEGKRLAKRDDARALSLYRAEGATPDDIRRLVGL